jgi:hypothetical protein
VLFYRRRGGECGTGCERRGVAGSDPAAAPVGGACTGGVQPALK